MTTSGDLTALCKPVRKSKSFLYNLHTCQ